MSTELHEANHVAVAIWLGRPVAHVYRTLGHALPGDELGLARIPIRDRIEPSQVVICLAGYMAEDTPDWPPPWPDCLDERLEALGTVLVALDADRERYERTVQFTRDLVADPDFRRLRDAIARALGRVPRLEPDDLKALCSAHRIPCPEEEPELCSI